MAKIGRIKTFRTTLWEMATTRFFQVCGAVSIIFLALAIILPIWRLFPEITQMIAIPLHYNIHSGVDLFGVWQRIFTIPLIGGIILLLNTLISISLWRKEKVLSYFFSAVAAFSQILAFVSMIFVVLLNLSYA